MALSTYANLTSAVGNWLHRSDLSTFIPDFVTLAEKNIHRRLRIRSMETEITVTAVAGTRTVALPSNFLEARRVYISNTSPVQDLDYIDPDNYWRRWMSSTSGQSVAYTVEGDNILLGPVPAGAYHVNFLYYKEPDALSTTAHPTFTANPDLYLFASLMEAHPFCKDDKRFPLWAARLEKALQEAQDKDTRDRHGAGPLTIRTQDQVV